MLRETFFLAIAKTFWAAASSQKFKNGCIYLLNEKWNSFLPVIKCPKSGLFTNYWVG